jgi:WD40 repeat protein/serine/threonine protein kinase
LEVNELGEETPVSEQELFVEAFQISEPADREAYLDRACGTDSALRQRIAGLLGALGRAGEFLEAPVAGPDDPGATRTRPQHSAEAPGDFIGPYRLMEQIGEGGFGLVFVAEQQYPVRRRVALKVIKPGMDSRQVVARFEAERQALALMDHPNIAKVLDGGTTDSGRPFFVMELVKGVSITQFCDDNRLFPRDRLKLFADLCSAVQHAHQKGIIHRDLKPSNVLVSSHDGTPVVKVIDFGVAKAVGQTLTDKTVYTGLAQMVGTPLYMSPEQTGSSGLDVDTRTDIYALGVLLYELLTGTTPFDRERLRNVGYDEIRRIIREEEPARPSNRISTLGPAAATISAQRQTEPAKLTRLVRGELDWIVMKCLEKDRNRRYQTAAGLGADVRRFLCDEPVQACPPSAWYRFRKLARRNRRALVTVSVLTLAAGVGVGALAVSTVLVWKANKELRESVDRERREAYFQRITVAHRELSMDNLDAALRALEDCPEDLRGWEWHYLMRLCKVNPLVIRDTAEVNGVAFSPDGERLASAGGDGAVRIWNSRTGERIQEFKAHDKAACGVAFHPDGRHLASTGADGLVKVWELASGREVFRGPCDALRKFGAAYTVAFRPPDGRHLAAGSKPTVTLWDWENRRPLHTFGGHEHHTMPVAFSPDGRRLATGGAFGEGQNIWDAESGRQLLSLPASQHPVTAAPFSPDGRRLALASLGRNVTVLDSTTGERLQTLAHSGNVLGAAFSLDGRRLATTGEDKTVRIWDPETGREVLGLRGHAASCGCVAFSPDGHRLASASLDGTIRVWDATPLRGDEGQEVFTFAQQNEEIRSVAVSPDGERVVSAGLGPHVQVWTAATGQPIVVFPGHTSVVFSAAWHPDGQRIATAGLEGPRHTVKVWDARTGREHFAITAEQGGLAVPYTAVAFRPDGRYLVTGKQEGAVQVWEAQTGREVHRLVTHRRDVRGVVFSPDGKHLVSASSDGEVKLWDATRLNEKQDPRILPIRARVPGPSLNVAFSPDARRLATGGEENTVKIWDVQDGRELHTLRGHNGEIYTVAFSPDKDGRWIASGGEDSTVKIWDSRAGKLVHSFRGHTGLVSSLAFSPDGRRLYSGSRDKTVKVWDLTQLSPVPEK